MATLKVQAHVRALRPPSNSGGNAAAEFHLQKSVRGFPHPCQPWESPVVSFQEQFSPPGDVRCFRRNYGLICPKENFPVSLCPSRSGIAFLEEQECSFWHPFSRILL